MDGSTRMGSRSSTRHGGPGATVFQGPVRKWRKAWTPIATTSANHASSRVLLYKWSPISANKDDMIPEDTAPQAVKFVPMSIVMARKMEEAKQAEAATKAQKESASGEPQTRNDHKRIDVEMLPESDDASESDGVS